MCTAAADRYDSMEYRRCGDSGLRLPAISLGFWQNFGDDRSPEVQRALMRTAFDRGVTHFDLANNYGPPPGAAEINAGRILREDFAGHRDELILSTKAGFQLRPGPYGQNGSKKYLTYSLDQTLRKLGVDYVDIFYHHRPDPETPLEETAEALALAVLQGKALHVGVSNYSASQIEAMNEALAAWNLRLLVTQPPYSMFERTIEAEVLPTVRRLGLGTVVWSPLQQGLLTDRYLDGTIPADSRAAAGRFLHREDLTAEYYERARALAGIAAERGQTLAQFALAWVLSTPGITSAIVGASSTTQLEQNLGALDAPALTEEERVLIEPYAVDGTGRLTW